MRSFEIKAPAGLLGSSLLCLITSLGSACSESAGDFGDTGGGGSGAVEPEDEDHAPFEPSAPANAAACAPTPDGSSGNVDGKTYYRYRSWSNTTWMGSEADCEAMGGKLAKPTSATVNNALRGMLSSQPMWIGLFQPWNQTGVNQNWGYSDGSSPLSYTYWLAGNPNDSDGYENNGQNCVYMTGSGADIGRWNDWPCYQAYSYDYACEFSSTSLPTTCTGTYNCVLGSGATAYGCADCTLAHDTTETTTVSSSGCHVLARDASGCQSSRQGAGITSSIWQKFSCRVSLGVDAGGNVVAVSDGRPDYASVYFPTTDACYENYTGNTHNPNTITSQSYTVTFPSSPNTSSQSMAMNAVVGMAVNGVPIFGNFAAPQDDIFEEAETFDRCNAHPDEGGQYHYHSEPLAITNDDANLVGMMRDGYPVYGRKDANGTYPSLDQYGGHTGVTPDSGGAHVYHYHVNQQTQTDPNKSTYGESQWFITKGTWRGAPGACTGCN